MDEVRTHPEGQLEGSETRSSEQQALDNATYQPRSYVEQNGNYPQAETIQTTLVSVVENTSTAQDISATPLPIPNEAKDVGATPLPIPREAQDISATPLPIPREAQDISATPLPIPREAQDISATPLPIPLEAQDVGVTPVSGEPGHLTPENLPEQAKDFVGEGTHGMINNGVEPGIGLSGLDVDQKVGLGKNIGPGAGPGTSGAGPSLGTSITGPGKTGNQPGMPMSGGKGPSGPGTPGKGTTNSGPGTSKSGPPVNAGKTPGGGGTSGEPGAPSYFKNLYDAAKDWGKEQREKDLQGLSEGKTTITKEGMNYTMKDGIWVFSGFPEKKDEIPPEGDPIEGTTPTPYTGQSTGGEEPQPDVVGGNDIESGKFTPIVSIEGKIVSGGGIADPADLDDSANFYGGLSASSGRPNNPDDPDYYTPNILEEAAKELMNKGK
jgi:hypothetical protein